jgi:hypothetical protein
MLRISVMRTEFFFNTEKGKTIPERMRLTSSKFRVILTAFNGGVATMDTILELLAGTAPEFAGGMTNHGPMAAEALWHLGKQEEALRWTAQYVNRLEPHRANDLKFAEADWREYLGRQNFYDAWRQLIERDISNMGWRGAVRKWLPRLLPGMVSAAAHGVLRTAHAVRSLESEETRLSRGELASGIGYWASTFQSLPSASTNKSRARASRAIANVKFYPYSEKQEFAQISDGIKLLDGQSDFAEVIDLLDTDLEFEACLNDLLDTFTLCYLANSSSSLIAAVHEVTGMATLQVLSPYLEVESRTQALRYAWQASSALHVMFDTEVPKDMPQSPVPGRDELIERAIASGDEHAIKLTEVCLRDPQSSRANLYHYAALDAIRHFQEERELV